MELSGARKTSGAGRTINRIEPNVMTGLVDVLKFEKSAVPKGFQG